MLDDLEFDPEDWTSVEKMIAQLREKAPLPAEEFYALQEAARRRAFTVSGVADLDVVATVWEAIDKAVEDGETLEDFRARVGDLLEDEWGGEDASRLDMIFRTNVQQAYSAGRADMNSDPAVRQTHPYVRFSVVEGDDRTCEICEPLTDVVLPQDDAFVASHQPPLHPQCRCDVVAVTDEEAREIGIADEGPADSEPADGFGGDPLADWNPDLSSRPVELAAIFELKSLS